MLHPILDPSNFNVAVTFSGLYLLIFGLISIKIKQKWYLGEALPSFIAGTILGPFVSGLVDARQWSHDEGQIAYALTRLVLGLQMVKVGYELPKRYIRERLVELTICLLPLMTLQWILTSSFIFLMIPHSTFLTASIIGSCVNSIDPILSQAVAKGPFADKYVRRHLREFISAEAGGNDGFGFPFLLLSMAILRYSDASANRVGSIKRDWIGETGTGRFGGDLGRALAHWAVEGVLYMIVASSAYGQLVGYLGRKSLNLASRRRWIDKESFFIFPLAIGLFIVGTCGCFGSDETLACFIAGCALNWDGLYHSEAEARHDSFNSAIEVIMNAGTFTFIGISMPWNQMKLPTVGVTPCRLVTLGVLLLLFRRMPVTLLGYRFMPKVVFTWKEALFMGYFGPIGVGAISYVEYARRLLPGPGHGDPEINNLTTAMIPVVYFLVFFSIVVHGLSVPVLNCIYGWLRVPIICDHPVEVKLLSENEPVPNNSIVDRRGHSVILNNRFSRLSNYSESDSHSLHDLSEITVLRSSGQDQCTEDMNRHDTKSSPRQEEQIEVREIV